MDKGVERQINQIYKEIYKKVFTNEVVNSLSRNNRIPASNKLLRLQSSNKYDEFASKFAYALAKKGLNKQRGIWRKYYEAAKASHKGVIPVNYKQFEFGVLSKAVQHNFQMIKSIPNEMMEILNHKYTSTLIEEVAKGNLPRGSFKKQLQEHGYKQAGVIARTETAKLQTAITQQRAESIGSKAYIWLSSKDKRTRPSHRAMDGVVVFWREYSQKPLLDNMRGNAGEFPNCRCDAQPIVDEDDLKNNFYKVYNYNTDNVITMSKKQLKEALRKGEI